MSSEEYPNTRKMFDEFKQKVDAMLKQMDDETRKTEQESEQSIKQSANTFSNSQILLAEVNDFGKDLADLKKTLSETHN